MEALNNTENEIRDKVFEKNADIVSRKIAGELFLVPVKGKLGDMQQLYTLNAVAEYIWQELGAQKSLKDILDGIVEEFNVTKKEADSDLQGFISELLEAGLIKE
jgi:hypothetical protein